MLGGARMRLRRKPTKAAGSAKAGSGKISTSKADRSKSASSKPRSKKHTHRTDLEADISPWTEGLFAAEVLLLHATPVYYGFGVRRGEGSGVIVIPGFLGTDLYLMELHAWLGRIGYRAYFSGIGVNAECPNLLVKRHLDAT